MLVVEMRLQAGVLGREIAEKLADGCP